MVKYDSDNYYITAYNIYKLFISSLTNCVSFEWL